MRKLYMFVQKPVFPWACHWIYHSHQKRSLRYWGSEPSRASVIQLEDIQIVINFIHKCSLKHWCLQFSGKQLFLFCLSVPFFWKNINTWGSLDSLFQCQRIWTWEPPRTTRMMLITGSCWWTRWWDGIRSLVRNISCFSTVCTDETRNSIPWCYIVAIP